MKKSVDDEDDDDEEEAMDMEAFEQSGMLDEEDNVHYCYRNDCYLYYVLHVTILNTVTLRWVDKAKVLSVVSNLTYCKD